MERCHLERGRHLARGSPHNDVPWNRSDDTCNGPADETIDWTAFTDECIAAEVERFTPKYLEVFSTIAALRGDKPTILRTINRYNDWIGMAGRGPATRSDGRDRQGHRGMELDDLWRGRGQRIPVRRHLHEVQRA